MTVSSIASSYVGAKIGLQTADTIPQFSPGTRVDGDMGGLYIYGLASAAIAQGDFVVFNNNYNASLLTTTNSQRGAKVAVSRAPLAANQYGWFQVEGQAAGRTVAAVAANAQLNTTATGGAVDDDAAVGAKRLEAIAILVAAAGATTNTEFMLSSPYVGATL
jgi:hypothetical protein